MLRHIPGTNSYPQASVGALVSLLGCYMAGIRYALELQALQRGVAEPSQTEEDDTNQSVSSIEDDFVTALEHLEEDDTADNPCRCQSVKCIVAFCSVSVGLQKPNLTAVTFSRPQWRDHLPRTENVQ